MTTIFRFCITPNLSLDTFSDVNLMTLAAFSTSMLAGYLFSIYGPESPCKNLLDESSSDYSFENITEAASCEAGAVFGISLIVAGAVYLIAKKRLQPQYQTID